MNPMTPMTGFRTASPSAPTLLHQLLVPHLSRPVSATLVLLYLVLITGSLHEDGLADTSDGFGGGRSSPEKILLILRDSRIGSFGGVALALSPLGRLVLIPSIPLDQVSSILISAAVLSRWTTLPLSCFLAPARRPDIPAHLGQGARIAHLPSPSTLISGAFCGHSDPPINARGEQQVADLIARLGPHPFAKIYSSDLCRAHNTAHLLAASSATPIETTPHLREIHFGDWEGPTWSEIELRDQAFAQRWIADFPTLTPPGRRTLPPLQGRILAEVDRIRSLSSAHTVALVTHAGALRILRQPLFACSERQAW